MLQVSYREAGRIIQVLKACSASRDLQTGKRIHAQISSSADRRSSASDRKQLLAVNNALLDMYIKCGSFAEARRVFDGMQHRSVVSWTSMMLGCVQMGESDRALEIFFEMQQDQGGLVPDARSYVVALKACAKKTAFTIQEAKAIHSQIVAAGHQSDIFVANALISLYSKLGDVMEAREVFNRLPMHDVACWNAIIAANARNGEVEAALELLSHMQRETRCKPNARTFVAAISACSSLAKDEGTFTHGVLQLKILERALLIHKQVAEAGFDSELIVANALMDLYAKCGAMDLARSLFDKTSHKSVVSWTTMISAYAQSGQPHLALLLYERMRDDEGLMLPDAGVFVAVLKACGNEKQLILKHGREIHSRIVKAGLDQSDTIVASCLIDMYAKLGSSSEALEVFNKTKNRDVVLWNSMLVCLTQCRQAEEALRFFQRMQDEQDDGMIAIKPNARTYVAALAACVGLLDESQGKLPEELTVAKIICLSKGMAVHREIVSKGGCEDQRDRFVASALVDLYARCGRLSDARNVFEKFSSCRDVVLWNSIITGYSQNDEAEAALELFSRMQRVEGIMPNARSFLAALHACSDLASSSVGGKEQGRNLGIQLARVIGDGEADDVFLGSASIDLYSKCGMVDQAQQIFDRMQQHNVVSWTAVISGNAQNGRGDRALELFHQMQEEGVEPNARTYAAALKACLVEGSKACTRKGMMQKAIGIHSQLGSLDQTDVFLGNTLVDLYAKFGRLDEAQRVFDRMQQRSLISWNSLINAYADHGQTRIALEIFARMRDEGGFRPDAVTYAAVLKACGKSASLDAGREIHAQLSTAGFDDNVAVTNSLVSFYGKCSSMSEAQLLFDSAATRDVVTWSSLMAGYAWQGDGWRVLELFELMPKEYLQPDGVIFLHVLSACSHSGLVEEGEECFRRMRAEFGIRAGAEHYACVVDLLGRANRLDDALVIVEEMGSGGDEEERQVWETILGACCKWKNNEVGQIAFQRLEKLRACDVLAQVLRKE